MNLKAVIDDCYREESGTYVLAGHIFSEENINKLETDWKNLLPTYGILLDKDNQKHFKMNQMNHIEERLERVSAFYRIIEEHVLCSVSVAYNAKDLERAKRRIYVENLNINWGFLDNKYLFAFRCLMDMFHMNRDNESIIKVIPQNETVDFIFDIQAERNIVHQFWDDYVNSRPEDYKKYYGCPPLFKDDKDFVSLQSADLWAWWVNKWVEEGQPELMNQPDFGVWKALKEDHPKLHISFNEDQIVETAIKMVRETIEPHRVIYDLKGMSS